MKPTQILTFTVPFPASETGPHPDPINRTITVFPFEDHTLPLFQDGTATGNQLQWFFNVHGQTGYTPQRSTDGGFVVTRLEAEAIRAALNALEEKEALILPETVTINKTSRTLTYTIADTEFQQILEAWSNR